LQAAVKGLNGWPTNAGVRLSQSYLRIARHDGGPLCSRQAVQTLYDYLYLKLRREIV
jgi:hypothetical protein